MTDAFDAARLATPACAALRAYDPGHDLPALRARFGTAIAELGSNENVLGPSPRALAAMRAALDDVYRYPDPRGAALKAALADRLGVTAQQIALGNGSHELLMMLAQCFADAAHSVVYSRYGFAVYPIAAAAAGAAGIAVPALPRTDARAPLGHDLAAMAAAVRADTRLIYLANPNNPTGTWFDDAAHLAAVRRYNSAARSWLVDELARRGYRCLPSQTNFVLLDLGRDAAPLERHLLGEGVIVRPMGGYGLGQTLRISIGRRDENERLLAALDALP